jgi:hypothetical protein
MKVAEVPRIVLRGIAFCAVGVACASCLMDHPFPRDEIYEARDPNTNRPVMRIQNTLWTDGRTGVYYGTIKFRQLDGAVLSIELRIENDPNYWKVEYCQPDAEPQKIPLKRIYGPSISPRNFDYKCWVEEGEPFGE